ncbi:glycosyltransferase [Nonomuraea sp. NPDC004354]
MTREVGALIEKTQPNAIHAQHLGFALSLAFTRAAGNVPIIAIAHGRDVMAAERSERDRELLHEVVAASASVVAPTAALAGRIDQLTGRRCGDRIAVIPWGIPLGDVRRPRPPRRLQAMSTTTTSAAETCGVPWRSPSPLTMRLAPGHDLGCRKTLRKAVIG